MSDNTDSQRDRRDDLQRAVRELRLPVLELGEHLCSGLPDEVENALDDVLTSFRSLSLAIKRAR